MGRKPRAGPWRDGRWLPARRAGRGRPRSQHWLDRRKPGQNKYHSHPRRRNPTQVEIPVGRVRGAVDRTHPDPADYPQHPTSGPKDLRRHRGKGFRPRSPPISPYWQKYGTSATIAAADDPLGARDGGRGSRRAGRWPHAAASLAQMVRGPGGITGYNGAEWAGRTASTSGARFAKARSSATPFWVPRRAGRGRMGRVSGIALRKSGDSVGRGGDRGHGLGRARGPWCADLRQARHRPLPPR